MYGLFVMIRVFQKRKKKKTEVVHGRCCSHPNCRPHAFDIVAQPLELEAGKVRGYGEA
jgi:hypothetical protein